MQRVLDAHRARYGVEPGRSTVEPERDNMRNFQIEYDRFRFADNTLPREEIARRAIAEAPFGRWRLARGYQIERVTLGPMVRIDVNENPANPDYRLVPESMAVNFTRSSSVP